MISQSATLSVNNQTFPPPKSNNVWQKGMKSKIYVDRSGIKNAGRGVFAAANIRKNEVIEVCPILIFDKRDTTLAMKTALGNYVYAYDGDRTLMALGFGSLYNNQSPANAKYELQVYDGMSEQDSELVISALRPIAEGEEILIDYGIPDYLKMLKA